jgi:hypothetical protein
MKITSHRYHDDFAGGHSGRRRFARGEIKVCCHRVTFYYEIGHSHLTPDDLSALEALAEVQATAMIVQGCNMGELFANLLTPVRKKEREFYGWWKIECS